MTLNLKKKSGTPLCSIKIKYIKKKCKGRRWM